MSEPPSQRVGGGERTQPKSIGLAKQRLRHARFVCEPAQSNRAAL
jgi:hypothetical protein